MTNDFALTKRWLLLRRDGQTVSITAQFWDVLRAGALQFYNGYGVNFRLIALYPRGEWLYVTENVD